MKQKDLDKLRTGIDPELQEIFLGDADDLDVDSASPHQSDDPILELITGVGPARSVTKTSVDIEFSDLLGNSYNDGLGVDGEGSESTISQVEFLKGNSSGDEHNVSLISPVKEKSEVYRSAQDKFIKVSRWLRDRLNKIATPDEQQSGEVQKVWTRVFGFSSDRLNDDADAREAVRQMVTNVSVRLIQEDLADQKA